MLTTTEQQAPRRADWLTRACLGLALAVMVPLAALGLAMYWP
jgi:hypothetical protein